MRHDLRDRFHRTAGRQAAAAAWGCREEALEYLQASENFVYRAPLPDGRIVYLRLTSAERRARDQIQAELDFVSWLDAQGLPVAAPVPALGGQLLVELELPDGVWLACAFAALTGEVVTWGGPADNARVLRERGEALGRLHALSARYVAPGPARDAWDRDPEVTRAEALIPASEDFVRAERDALVGWLEDLPRPDDTFGLIHGDLGSTNYFRTPTGLALFDFDDTCQHWFAYDLAVAIWPVGLLPLEARLPLRDALFEGYSRSWRLPADPTLQLEQFCRWRTLWMYLHHLRTFDLDRPDEDEARKLRLRRQAIRAPVEWT